LLLNAEYKYTMDETLVVLYWDKFRIGDKDAFNKLIKIHYNYLYSYGYRFAKDQELVKDCIQDIFLALWKNRETIGPTSSVKFYLMAALRRKLQRELQKNQSHLFENGVEFSGFELVSPAESKIIREEQLRDLTLRMSSILQKLSKRQQEVIYLKFYAEADVDEISDIMQLNRQSVYNLLHDSLKKLKSITHKDAVLLTFLELLLPLSLIALLQ
jgi:RNA polymerase sigma factor (sigma-70 family)